MTLTGNKWLETRLGNYKLKICDLTCDMMTQMTYLNLGTNDPSHRSVVYILWFTSERWQYDQTQSTFLFHLLKQVEMSFRVIQGLNPTSSIYHTIATKTAPTPFTTMWESAPQVHVLDSWTMASGAKTKWLTAVVCKRWKRGSWHARATSCPPWWWLSVAVRNVSTPRPLCMVGPLLQTMGNQWGLAISSWMESESAAQATKVHSLSRFLQTQRD